MEAGNTVAAPASSAPTPNESHTQALTARLALKDAAHGAVNMLFDVQVLLRSIELRGQALDPMAHPADAAPEALARLARMARADVEAVIAELSQHV